MLNYAYLTLTLTLSFPHALSLKRSRRPLIFTSFLEQVNHYQSAVEV